MGLRDRLDEAKGKLKEGADKLTDDEQLAAEGRAEAESARARRKVKGLGREAGGAVKEKVGELTGDEATRAAGRAGRLRGKAERSG